MYLKSATTVDDSATNATSCHHCYWRQSLSKPSFIPETNPCILKPSLKASSPFPVHRLVNHTRQRRRHRTIIVNRQYWKYCRRANKNSKMSRNSNIAFYIPKPPSPTVFPSTFPQENSSGMYPLLGNSKTPLLDSEEDHSHFDLELKEFNGQKTESGNHYVSRNQSLVVNSQIQLRFLNPGDYEIVKQLCEEWFPVEYPAKWFEAITSDTNLYSLAASIDGNIIGLIVSELKNGRDLSRDDRDLLCDSQLKFSVSYILSLGVVDEYRRQGIASLLLASLLNYLSTIQCKAVYLHVLTSNERALHFYEKHNFRVHKFLPYYYSIGGKAKDGFTYVLYLNGGHGPWGLCEYVQHICEVTIVEVCSLPGWCLSQLRRVVQSLVTLVK